MIRFKRLTGYLLLTAVTCGALAPSMSAATAYGASPEFARSAEEWESLRDNKLDWNEIPALIEEYNATVLTNKDNFAKDERRLMDAEEVKNYMLDQADDMDEAAVQLDGTELGSVSAAQQRAAAASMREQADENVTDAEVIRMGYDQIEDTLSQNARILYLSYYQAISEKAAAEKNLAYLKKLHQSAQNRFQVGAATQLEVLTALENVQNAEAALVSADANISANKKELMVLCGWRYDGDAEIGALPEFDPNSISAIDLSADTETALQNSYTLRLDRKKLENAKQSDNVRVLTDKYEKQLKTDTDQVKTAVKTAYDSLVMAKSSYDNTVAELSLKAQNLETARLKLSLGTISQMEFAEAEHTVEALQGEQESKYIALLTAYTKYEGTVKGLA